MNIKERKKDCIDMKFVDVTEEVLANKEEYNYYNVIDFWVIYEQKNEEWETYTIAQSSQAAKQKVDWLKHISLSKWKIEHRYFKYVKED